MTRRTASDGAARPRGRVPRPRGRRPRGRRRLARVAQGRDPRRRRRVGLRQVDPGAGDAAAWSSRPAARSRSTATPLDGKRGLDELRRRLQMIFQDPYQTLNPRQRVRTIVTEPLQRAGRRQRRARARVSSSALDDVGLEPERFAERYPHQLSGGQRQRVAIAAALVLEPDGLICDEPVSMLDVSVQAQILAVLLELKQRRELALLFITHDLSLAWTLCDRIAVMYLGRVVEQGSAVDVIERPQHPYTQALVERGPGADAGRRRAARAAQRRAPRRDRRAQRLSLPPALPEALRALRQGRPAAAAGRRRATSSRPACCTIPSTRAPPRRLARLRRQWLSAGATSPARSGWSSPGRATRSPTCPASASATRRPRAASRPGSPWSRRRRCRRRRRPRSSTGWASSPARSRSTSAGRWRRPVYLCGSHAVGTVHHAAVLASGRGPERHRPAGGRRVRRLLAGRLAHGDDRRRRAGARGARRRGRRGHRRRRHRDDVLRLPGRDRDRLAGGRRPPRRRAAALQLRRPRAPRPARHQLEPAASARLRRPARASPSAPPTRRWRPHQLRRLALRPLLGLVRVGSYAAEGSGEIGLAFSTGAAGRRSPTTSSTPTSSPPGRRPRRRSTTASSPRGPGEMRDGTMQDEFPIELRARARAPRGERDGGAARRGRRAGPRR